MSSARCFPPPLCLVFAVASLAAPPLAGAETFTVNSADDIVDALPGNAKCRTTTITGGVCRLRAAVQEANALAGPDLIVRRTYAGSAATIASSCRGSLT